MLFVKKVGSKTFEIEVGPHVVSMSCDGEYLTNANVDYYYAERGYNCKTDKQVSEAFFLCHAHLAYTGPNVWLIERNNMQELDRFQRRMR